MFREAPVNGLELSETEEGLIEAGNHTDTRGVAVGDEQLFLAMATILLESPFDPNMGNGAKRVVHDGETLGSAKASGLGAYVTRDNSASNQTPIRKGASLLGPNSIITRGLGAFG
jgi:hypothetical protein